MSPNSDFSSYNKYLVTDDIPMKKGEFKAKIELMCAEYEDPEKQN